MHSVMIAIEYSYKLGRKSILCANLASFCTDSHIYIYHCLAWHDYVQSVFRFSEVDSHEQWYVEGRNFEGI